METSKCRIRDTAHENQPFIDDTLINECFQIESYSNAKTLMSTAFHLSFFDCISINLLIKYVYNSCLFADFDG